jgi:hypothetical protein
VQFDQRIKKYLSPHFVLKKVSASFTLYNSMFKLTYTLSTIKAFFYIIFFNFFILGETGNLEEQNKFAKYKYASIVIN